MIDTIAFNTRRGSTPLSESKNPLLASWKAACTTSYDTPGTACCGCSVILAVDVGGTHRSHK